METNMPDISVKAERRSRKASTRITRHVLVCAPKGGVGKTTISRSLLVCGAQAGLTILGVDLDPQRGLTNWAERREATRRILPDVAAVPAIHKRFSTWQPTRFHEGGPDLVVIDTPPSLGDFSVDVLRICELMDFVVIPLQPSFDDWEQVATWMATLRGLGVRAVFQFNQTNPIYKSYSKLLGAAMKVGSVSPRPIPRLEAIHGFSDRGLTVHDAAGVRGADELGSVFDFVKLEIGL